MRCIVLCPGPSVLKFPGRGDDCHSVIGVNRAPHILGADRVQVDWWTFADARIFNTYTLDYQPAVFTTLDSWTLLSPKLQGHAVRNFEMLRHEWPLAGGWAKYSALAAILLADRLGATSIDVYGCDLAGIADADGHEYDFPDARASGTRTDKRWVEELGLLTTIVDRLGQRGVQVNRIQS